MPEKVEVPGGNEQWSISKAIAPHGNNGLDDVMLVQTMLKIFMTSPAIVDDLSARSAPRLIGSSHLPHGAVASLQTASTARTLGLRSGFWKGALVRQSRTASYVRYSRSIGPAE